MFYKLVYVLMIFYVNSWYKNMYQLNIHFFNIGNLSRNFKGGGRNIRFGKLFDELAEKFPDAKISRLKDLIQSKM